MNLQEYMLSKLQEEAIEVSHAISKAKTFGLHDVNPNTNTTNAEHIVQEFAEMQAVLEMCYELGIPLPTITDESLRDRKEAKKIKVLQYMKVSRDRGTLQMNDHAQSE